MVGNINKDKRTEDGGFVSRPGLSPTSLSKLLEAVVRSSLPVQPVLQPLCIIPTNMARDDIQDVYIAVMGVTGAGKSSFISTCTGKPVKIGHDLKSCMVPILACVSIS